jgi:hypothetical protein
VALAGPSQVSEEIKHLHMPGRTGFQRWFFTHFRNASPDKTAADSFNAATEKISG